MMHLAIERVEGYEFRVRVEESNVTDFTTEEEAPLGKGRSPSPEALLGAAVGSCLSASLLFCLGKAHVDVDSLRTQIDIEQKRNERGRLRIGSMKATLRARIPEGQRPRFERCRDLFEDFCVVTESVRGGIPVEVSTEQVFA